MSRTASSPGTRSVATASATRWPRYPSIFEINTWVWLSQLSTGRGQTTDLSSVPSREWDRLAALGVDAVWLMGVWERSPAGIAIANRNEHLLADFRRALPDFTFADNVGSPYCVRRYEAAPQLGGREGLARARRELAMRGLRLVLDFVPNHVAPDHPWVTEHPRYFIQGTADEARQDPGAFVTTSTGIFACGRDPYFPAWPDVLQLNAFDVGLRAAAVETVSDIADQCDAVRCDMAMLLLNAVFARTWGQRAGAAPATEYWTEVIPTVKRTYPDFLFIAEAYWDLEWALQQLGFDLCYDKRLYDRLEHERADSIRAHLTAPLDYQSKLVRFIENHDEPRAASAFPAAKARSAAVVASTLPGARLFHDGQFEGRRTRLPVFLSRQPIESFDLSLRSFYTALLAVVTSPALRDGEWKPCTLSGWPDNASYHNLVAWSWQHGESRYLIIVNLSEHAAQAHVRADLGSIAGATWQLRDAVSGHSYTRSGDELVAPGVFIDLGPWHSHVFEVRKDISHEAGKNQRAGRAGR
jgi:hypothetical protein